MKQQKAFVNYKDPSYNRHAQGQEQDPVGTATQQPT